MKPVRSGGARRDLALIMARGDSSRMGFPKGLAVLADDARPLLVRIVDLYLQRGMRVLVVTHRLAAVAYAELLVDHPDVEMLPAEPGGGTGRTVGIAYLQERDRCTHLWAHPVDLPLVRAETLDLLLSRSASAGEQVIRPSCDGRPGHPVVLPLSVLAALDRQLPAAPGGGAGGLIGFEGDMKELFAHTGPGTGVPGIRNMEVADPGVVLDFDSPSPEGG